MPAWVTVSILPPIAAGRVEEDIFVSSSAQIWAGVQVMVSDKVLAFPLDFSHIPLVSKTVRGIRPADYEMIE